MEVPFGCLRAGRISEEQGGGGIPSRGRHEQRQAHRRREKQGQSLSPPWVAGEADLGDSRGPADHPVLSDAAAFGFLSSHSPRLLEYSPQDF